MAFVSLAIPFTQGIALRTAPRLQTSRPPSSAASNSTFRRAGQTILAAAPRQVSADELETVLKSKPGPVIVDAMAKWCGPCQFLIPQLETLAEKMGDRMQILKLDTDEEAEYASAIGVRGLPTLFFIQDGQLKYRMEGALTAEQLEELSEHLFFEGPEPSFNNPDVPTV